MSLISLLRGDTTTSSSDVALNTLTQKLAARQSVALSKVETGGTGTSGTATAGSSGVLITQAARQALAARTDADTPAETLADEARATLDKQYGSSGKAADPDMAAFSNRALSLVVLNEDGGFSRQEVATARAELQSRDRNSLLEAIAASGLSAASLTSWQNQQLIARQNMSAEEAQLRDSGGALR